MKRIEKLSRRSKLNKKIKQHKKKTASTRKFDYCKWNVSTKNQMAFRLFCLSFLISIIRRRVCVLCTVSNYHYWVWPSTLVDGGFPLEILFFEAIFPYSAFVSNWWNWIQLIWSFFMCDWTKWATQWMNGWMWVSETFFYVQLFRSYSGRTTFGLSSYTYSVSFTANCGPQTAKSAKS